MNAPLPADDDLVSRLRNIDCGDCGGAYELFEKAADEIERLRLIEHASRVFYKRVSARVPGLIAQLESVNLAMRAALRLDDDVTTTQTENS